jgi:hypothetical protein
MTEREESGQLPEEGPEPQVVEEGGRREESEESAGGAGGREEPATGEPHYDEEQSS